MDIQIEITKGGKAIIHPSGVTVTITKAELEQRLVRLSARDAKIHAGITGIQAHIPRW